ncbi:MAG: hypothetical protein ABI807_05775 [Sporichthyaceae bacterium]
MRTAFESSRSPEDAARDAREAVLRSAARLRVARSTAQHRTELVLAQRRVERARRQDAEANRLWSMYVPVNRLPVPRG